VVATVNLASGIAGVAQTSEVLATDAVIDAASDTPSDSNPSKPRS
jgi:class 3 adenylate cyclase